MVIYCRDSKVPCTRQASLIKHFSQWHCVEPTANLRKTAENAYEMNVRCFVAVPVAQSFFGGFFFRLIHWIWLNFQRWMEIDDVY